MKAAPARDDRSEAAAFKSGDEYNEILRGVLNAGYREGGVYTVCVGHGKDIGIKDFNCFCPKATAGIGRLPATVFDRSIPLRLKRAQRGPVERLRRKKVMPQADKIEADLAAWA